MKNKTNKQKTAQITKQQESDKERYLMVLPLEQKTGVLRVANTGIQTVQLIKIIDYRNKNLH